MRRQSSRFRQRMDSEINRSLWGLAKKLTPITLTGKLARPTTLGVAAAAAPLGFLGAALAQVLCPKNNSNKKKD